ncbi:hypothetical protein FRUB_05585 [Fimbriiglobus ruber]|uniref:Uncharacterized protein n=1 Tax=Fimbriiglobus ruber TaxID=1908690 RepID=A0A225DTI7_9BACT|nr:hypothetical protein FRUB_05585 [Fimbriiglobus ruber]
MVKIGIAVGIVAAVVAGVVWLGSRAGESVANRDRYAIPVASIACPAPPGLDRETFLTEVRYLGNLPETIQVVDPNLRTKLSAAFAKHPWVNEVGDIMVDADTTVRVDLKFRVPVLAVRVPGDAELRCVDRTCVLLPSVPNAAELPLFATPTATPTPPTGEVWIDPAVKRATELAITYQPKRIEKTDKGWRLTTDGKVLVVSW